jgi:hypothetical protein
VLDLGDGRSLVVDQSRDRRAVRTAAQRQGFAQISFAIDTHVHASA